MSIHEESKHYRDRRYHGALTFKEAMRNMLLGAEKNRNIISESGGPAFYNDFFSNRLKTVLTYVPVNNKTFQIIYVLIGNLTPELGAMREITMPNAPILYNLASPDVLNTVSPEDIVDARKAFEAGIERSKVVLSFSDRYN